MSRWRWVAVSGATLLFWAGGVRAQPVTTSPPVAAKPQPRQTATRTEPVEAKRAATRAKRAREVARCLRSASVGVDAAARRLRWARDDKTRQQRQGALRAALGKLDGCWNTAFTDGEAAPMAYPRAPQPTQPAPAAARRSNFGFGAIHVEGAPVDKHAVARPLRDHATRYRQCYDHGLRRSPNLEGTVNFRLHLAQSGERTLPTSVAIPQSSLGDEAVRRCLARALMTTAFPPQAAGSTVSLMMAFTTVAP